MYFPQLVFSRLLASIGVLIFHFAYMTTLLEIPILGRVLYHGQSLLGYFFVLAGFVLVVSMVRDGVAPPTILARTFWIKRLIRIYPLHLLALVLTVGLQQVMVAYHVPAPEPYIAAFEPGKFLAYVLLVQAWYPVYEFALVYNPVSWTLCVELLLTGLAPLLYRWMFTQNTPTLVVKVALVWIGSLLIHAVCIQSGMPSTWGFIWPPVHIPEFMLGMMGGFVMVRHRAVLQQRASRWRWVTLGSIALMIGMMALSVPLLHKNTLLLAPTYLLIVINNCLRAGWLTRLATARPIQYLGELSYGIYILQIPVSIVMLRFLDQWVDWQYKFLLLLFVVVLVGVSALAYRYVERPLRAYVGAALRKRQVQPQPVAL